MTGSSKRELPVTFDIIREKNLHQLKLLNSVIFPIKFPVSACCAGAHQPARRESAIGASDAPIKDSSLLGQGMPAPLRSRIRTVGR